MKKTLSIILRIFIICSILFLVDYAIFDFGCLTFCDYKSVIDEKINLSKDYDLLDIAKSAQKNGISADIKYINTGPQLVISTNHFGAEYRALLRYSRFGSSQVYIDFLDVREKAACYNPNLLIRLFVWKMFHDSGLETDWLQHLWISRVMYWPGIL